MNEAFGSWVPRLALIHVVLRIASAAWAAPQAPSAEQAPFHPTTDAVLHGHIRVHSFVIPEGVTIAVSDDLRVVSDTKIIVDGSLVALPRRSAQSDGTGISIMLSPSDTIVIRGMLRAGKGRSGYVDGAGTTVPGGNGGDVVLEARVARLHRELYAGNGGRGAPGVKGGDGGQVIVRGRFISAEDSSRITIYGGDGGAGGNGRAGQDGGSGGDGRLVLTDGDDGPAGSDGADETGGDGADGFPVGACTDGVAADFGVNAFGGNGGPGGDGGNAMLDGDGGRGGNGGRGGSGTAGRGGTVAQVATVVHRMGRAALAATAAMGPLAQGATEEPAVMVATVQVPAQGAPVATGVPGAMQKVVTGGMALSEATEAPGGKADSVASQGLHFPGWADNPVSEDPWGETLACAVQTANLSGMVSGE